MADKYIKASECEKYFYEHLDDLHMTAAMNAIDEMPNADVALVRHGHWIRQDSIIPYYECSECHCSIDQEPHFDYSDNIMNFPKYCEHCGAKMDEKECNSK